jgi:hypothetical protein
MTTYTEPAQLSDFLKYELAPEQQFCRATVTIVSGQNLAAGTVVGKISASGKYTAYDNDASTGEQAAAGVLLFAVDASGGDKKGVILARGPAILAINSIAWGAVVTTQGEKDAAVVDLAALNILCRTDV